MKGTLFIGGANRGGKAVTDAALSRLENTERYEEIIVADPKEDRAQQLADHWHGHGLDARAYKERCENAIEKIDPDAIMLAIDTIKPMSLVLKKRPDIPSQWQLLARGVGMNGPVIGLSGTLVRGDDDNRNASMKLIDELGSFIAPQSSSIIRENPLNADFLHTMRKRVSDHSVRRLEVLDREPADLKNGPLNFLWGQRTYPLVIREKPQGAKWKETKELALDAELPRYLRDHSEFAIAAVGPKNVDFFVVESVRGRRIFKFYLPLIHTLPAPALKGGKAGLFGGAGGALAAAAMASAVVTD